MTWFLIGLAVLALLIAVAVVRARLRGGGRRPKPGRPPGRPTIAAPRPGEIWWADVPYEDGTGSKVRPCLVLRTRRGSAEVLKITSQDQRHRRDHVEIPTLSWDSKAERNSFLDVTGPIRVRLASFSRRAGTLDSGTWQKVRMLHRV